MEVLEEVSFDLGKSVAIVIVTVPNREEAERSHTELERQCSQAGHTQYICKVFWMRGAQKPILTWVKNPS